MGRVTNLDNSAMLGRPSGIGIPPQDLVIDCAHLRSSLDQFTEPWRPALHVLQRLLRICRRRAVLAIRIQVLSQQLVSLDLVATTSVTYLVREHPRNTVATASGDNVCTWSDDACA